MITTIYLFVSAITAYALMLFLVPILRKVAIRLNLTDQPNGRKIHNLPVPLVGGISISMVTALVSLVTFDTTNNLPGYPSIVGSSLFLLIVGVLDDKYDIRAAYKLLFQLFCAYAVAASGTRLTSLYGFFGVYEIPLVTQYVITIVLICGVVNAFNLMDGIDGLIGSLGLIGFSMLAVFSYTSANNALAVLFTTLAGATGGFLKFNLGSRKVFMGDAGSLLIGNLLIGSGLYLLQHSGGSTVNPVILYSMISFFALPVLDSLRVYLGRMKKGMSPFSADKSHLHHLFLILGLSHRQVTTLVSAITLCFLLTTLCLHGTVSLTLAVLVIVIVFSILGFTLNMNRKVNEWIANVKKMEQ
jgi:UDP-GlcNAc:undecaprenyl-phosphate/decaprenyl-phosphate GlcNAc-1-phosphate transferase